MSHQDFVTTKDQIVPYADSGPLSAKLIKNSTLKTYKGFPHLLAFIKS